MCVCVCNLKTYKLYVALPRSYQIEIESIISNFTGGLSPDGSYGRTTTNELAPAGSVITCIIA